MSERFINVAAQSTKRNYHQILKANEHQVMIVVNGKQRILSNSEFREYVQQFKNQRIVSLEMTQKQQLINFENAELFLSSKKMLDLKGMQSLRLRILRFLEIQRMKNFAERFGYSLGTKEAKNWIQIKKNIQRGAVILGMTGFVFAASSFTKVKEDTETIEYTTLIDDLEKEITLAQNIIDTTLESLEETFTVLETAEKVLETIPETEMPTENNTLESLPQEESKAEIENVVYEPANQEMMEQSNEGVDFRIQLDLSSGKLGLDDYQYLADGEERQKVENELGSYISVEVPKWGHDPNLFMGLVTQESKGEILKGRPAVGYAQLEKSALIGEVIKAFNHDSSSWEYVLVYNDSTKVDKIVSDYKSRYKNCNKIQTYHINEVENNPEIHFKVAGMVLQRNMEYSVNLTGNMNPLVGLNCYNKGYGNMQKILAASPKITDLNDIRFLNHTNTVKAGDHNYVRNVLRYMKGTTFYYKSVAGDVYEINLNLNLELDQEINQEINDNVEFEDILIVEPFEVTYIPEALNNSKGRSL